MTLIPKLSLKGIHIEHQLKDGTEGMKNYFSVILFTNKCHTIEPDGWNLLKLFLQFGPSTK